MNIDPVTIDYGQTLEEMIAAGKYDSVDEGITAERFAIIGEGKVTVQLVLLPPYVFESQAGERRLQPAKLEHLLAYGAQLAHGAQYWETDYERGYPHLVVALGSAWELQTPPAVPLWVDPSKPGPIVRTDGTMQIDRYVPYLHAWASGRCLNLIDMEYWGIEWDSYSYSVLAVCQ